jgi:succinate dehydrogenase hydrophobic anchor subunit
VIQEMLEASVAHSASLRKTMAWMLRCSAVFLALLAAIFIGSVYSWNVRGMILPSYAISNTLNIVQCGLIAFVFLWHRFLGLKMLHFVVGITLGMGFVAGLEPLLDALKDFRVADPRVADLLHMGAYHVSVLIWLYFARVQEEFAADSAVASLPNARKWALELGRITWP